MFKVGDKLICIKDNWVAGPCCTSLSPIKGEIYNVTFVASDGWVRLAEMNPEEEFNHSYFRKLDTAFGQTVAERIEKQIKEEELILNN